MINETSYSVVVGMEVHAQLLTNTKMFCQCSTDYQGDPPNTHTCPVCLGLPGALPVINRAAVEATIREYLRLSADGDAKFNVMEELQRVGLAGPVDPEY